MLIFFLRHGDASSDNRFHDSERPLTEKGENQAKTAGKFLQQNHAPIDAVYFSPLKRAQQTAEIVKSFISPKIFQVNEFLVNGTDQRQLIHQLKELNLATILLVGHIPHLPDTISLLINGNYDSDIGLKKCSLAIVDIPFSINPGTGKLKQIINNEAMAEFLGS
jgi:phosphohistidine phosphatase